MGMNSTRMWNGNGNEQYLYVEWEWNSSKLRMLTILFTSQYMSIYLYVFIFIGVNIGLQLFVGIVVNNFNEHKPDHSALHTVSQKRWTDLMQRVSLTRPIKLPPEPGHVT